jgi:hypothetical protein
MNTIENIKYIFPIKKMIGEEHYCAEILEKEVDWFNQGKMIIAFYRGSWCPF